MSGGPYDINDLATDLLETTGQNVGPGSNVFKQKQGTNLQFKTLVAGSNVTLSEGEDTITVSSSGGSGGGVTVHNDLTGRSTSDAHPISSITGLSESLDSKVENGASLGSGTPVFSSKFGSTLRFRSLVAGPGVSLAGDFNTVTISANSTSSPSVASIAALRTTTTNSTNRVNVTSYYAGGITGGGVFQWDSTSTATDNGGTVIQVTGVTTGRWIRVLDGFVTPEMFGAVGTESTNSDDYGSIQAAIDYCQFKGLTVYFSKKYHIKTGVTFKRRCGYLSATGSTLNGWGLVDDGCVFEGGNWEGRQILPIINGFNNFGIKFDGTSICNVFIPVVSNCADGVILHTNATTSPGMFDPNIEVQQIGKVVNAVVVESEAGCIMQGIEFKCNFIVDFSGAGITWRTTSASAIDWDSNNFIFQAADPLPKNLNATVIKNPLPFAVSRQRVRIETWLGGLANTAKIIDGKFNGLDFYFKPVVAILPGQFQLEGASNKVDMSSASNKSTPEVSATYSSNSLPSFNGGLPLWRNSTHIKYILNSNVLPGDVRVFYLYHQFTDKFSGYFSVEPSEMGSTRSFIVERVVDNSQLVDKEIMVTVRNVSGQTWPTGTVVSYKLKAGLI